MSRWAPEDAIVRFESKFTPEPNTGCWLWTASTKKNGYGRFGIGRTPHLAHRCAWVLFVGPIPEGAYVCHRCDTPSCVNPDHLFIGTPKDNVRDMMTKGRSKMVGPPPGSFLGEKNPMARLSNIERDVILASKTVARDLAKTYGISTAHVYQLRRRSKKRAA